MGKNGQQLSLTMAAFSLGISYERALRLVLCRKIEGTREGRSWKVTTSSVDRYKRENEQTLAAVAG